MEHASNLSPMSSDKVGLRSGQQEVIDLIQKQDQVIAQLPTGYGKTLVIDKSYEILGKQGVVNRLLVIVPTVAQLKQYKDCHPDCIDIGFFGVIAITKHQNNERDKFIITIQSLTQAAGSMLVQQLLQKGHWLIAVDEMHHFGMDKAWGETIKKLNYKKRLCLSATPFRPNKDGIFDKPDIVKNYLKAVEEGAVKKLVGHSYEYLITLIDKDGKSQQISTNNLTEKYGEGDDLDENLIKNKMHWSPKYIGPLIYNPIDRMITESIAGIPRLQAIVFCVSVKHCEVVCQQIKKHYGESVVVEWIGNGIEAFKPQEEINEIIRRFLRRPKIGETRFLEHEHIDVLCNYNMAGEGIDSVNVSEIIMLRGAGISNRDLQSYGRASRIIKENPDQVGNINFDSSSVLEERGFIGEALMEVFEHEYPEKVERNYTESEPTASPLIDWEILMNSIKILNIDLLNIKTDMGLMRATLEVMQELNVTGIPYDDVFLDNEHPFWGTLDDVLTRRRRKEYEAINEENTIEMLNQKLNGAISKLVGLVIKIQKGNGQEIEKNYAGEKKKLINTIKRQEIGALNNKDIKSIELHYKWIQFTERQMLENKHIPLWLA